MAGTRAAPGDRTNASFRPAQRRQPAGAFLSHQSLESCVNDSRLLAETTQFSGASEQGVIDVQCRAHMHQYARTMHTPAIPDAAGATTNWADRDFFEFVVHTFQERPQVRMFLGTFAVVTLCAACSAPAPQPVSNTAASDAAAHQAHEAYVTAINSNSLDSLLGMLTDDVVFLSAHEPVMVGKAAVKPWLEGYLKAFRTHWDKPVQEFVVNGDWLLSVTHTSQPTRLWPVVQWWRTRAGGSCSTITTRMANGAWRATLGARITRCRQSSSPTSEWSRRALGSRSRAAHSWRLDR